MSIFGKGVMAGGGKKPIPLSVSNNGTWNRGGGYNPVNISVPASAVTSGTEIITANGDYDVTEFKSAIVMIGTYAGTTPLEGFSYVDGLPNDWNTMKEIAKIISETSNSINANTTGSIYVNKGALAYKITPGDTISVNNYTYAVMGFNNFALTNQGNYGGIHSTAGLTFGAVNCVGEHLKKYPMNSSDTNSGGWEQCLMRTSTMPTLQSGMPNTLAQVKVPYVNYNQTIILYSDDYLFLPAEKEVFGTRSYSPKAEANALTQFAYYKNGGSKIKSLPGSVSAVHWWLRSIGYNTTNSFCIVNTSGSARNYTASGPNGAAPCFCV